MSVASALGGGGGGAAIGLPPSRAHGRRPSFGSGASEMASLLQPDLAADSLRFDHPPQPIPPRARKGSAGPSPAYAGLHFTGGGGGINVAHSHPQLHSRRTPVPPNVFVSHDRRPNASPSPTLPSHSSFHPIDASSPYFESGRKTPDPPRGSYRLNPHEMVQAHPPSAPPAPRDKSRHSKMAALASIPYPVGAMMSAAEPQRPPQHPTSAHPAAQRGNYEALLTPLPAPAAAPTPRGSIQSTIASARSSASAARTSLAQPGSSRFLANSPSPNSTPVKAPRSHFADNTHGSPIASPRSRDLTAETQRRRIISNAPIPIALSWPSDAATPAAHNGGIRAFPSRGSVRASHPSASPPPPPSIHAPTPSSTLPNFPSIMKRGAQLIDTLPPSMTHDEEDFEDVSLLDLVEDDAFAQHRSNATRISKNGRIGSGANVRGVSGSRRVGGVAAASVKKLDLASAQAFRSPYTRKSFANPAAAPAAKRGDVPPAVEWSQSDSEEEEDEIAPRSSINSDGGGSGGSGDGGWILDIGMSEDANPRYRASMEDAHVIRRSFGPVYECSAGHEDGRDENKESDARRDGSQRGSFFAIYDGHGGRAAVDFVARHFHRELARKLASSSAADVPRAIEAAVHRVDSAMALSASADRGQVLCDEFQDCGSTACFAYLRPCGSRNQGRELFLGNIGDAQAVLAVDKKLLRTTSSAAKTNSKDTGKEKKRRSTASAHRAPSPGGSSSSSSAASDLTRTLKKSRAASVGPTHRDRDSNGSASFAKTIARAAKLSEVVESAPRKLGALPLSYPHVATDPKEMARVKAAGGCVFGNRVSGTLAVSRAFGDHSLKSAGLSSAPYQQVVRLTPAHKFLIIGCDGIWDVLTYKQAVDAVSSMSDAQSMSQALVDLALKEGTTDNVSCMVVRFRA